MNDINGIPIHDGDLIRSFHFRDRTAHGKIRYLYHVIRFTQFRVEAVPFSVATGMPSCCGGTFGLRAEDISPMQIEVLDGRDWPWDRKEANA